MALLHRSGRGSDFAAANRASRINVSLWLAIGLVFPAVYGLALLIAAFLDTWNASG